MHAELIVLFWKLSEGNAKFRSVMLKTSAVLDAIVPILHYMNAVRGVPGVSACGPVSSSVVCAILPPVSQSPSCRALILRHISWPCLMSCQHRLAWCRLASTFCCC